MLDLTKCELKAPSIELMPSFVAALKEGMSLMPSSPVLTDEKIAKIQNEPELFLKEFSDPPAMLTLPNGDVVPRVPDTTFWFCDGNEYLGTIGIRHYLNENLKKFGGHIGYQVRPKYRGQGAASEMLRRALIFCREELNIDQALVTCDQNNIASVRVIEKSGGVLSEVVPNVFDNTKMTRRYWVPTL